MLKYFAVSLFCLSFSICGKTIQILHTNDLHSYFDGISSKQGGYARLKTMIDNLKDEAKLKGIPTLVVDAGDFGEGSSFFLARQGIDSFRALDLLGIEYTVLGNHDYMQGARQLEEQISRSGLKTKVLSANLKGKRRLGLKDEITSYWDHELDGLSIRIFGLSTNEIHFQYPLLRKGFIGSPIKSGLKHDSLALKSKSDLVIALTHIGLKKDIELAQKSKALDLIIGGHSHTFLSDPKILENSIGKSVPIFQAGAHGLAVGQILIDINQTENKILSYKLISINESTPPNPMMQYFVEAAKIERSRVFSTKDWNEIIAETLIPLSGYNLGKGNNSITCWGQHIAKMTRDFTQSDIGIHYAGFEGEAIAPGPVTFGQLIENFPRFRNFNDNGWEMVQVFMKGRRLARLLKFIQEKDFSSKYGLNIFGVNKNTKGENLMINNEPLNDKTIYSVSLPSEIILGIMKTLPLIHRFIMSKPYYTGISYWDSLEKYLKNNSPLRCL